MNLDELRAVQADERSADGLQALPDSFYRDVAAYLEELRAERDRIASQSSDPFASEDVQQLTDEIGTVEEVTEAIYERRIGKVMKQASLTASGVQGDEDGLTDEETALYHELVTVIESNREEVLSILQSDRSAPPASDSAHMTGSEDEVTTDEDESLDASSDPSEFDTQPPGHEDDDAASAQNDDEDTSQESIDRMTVRITKDVGEIFGVDERTYELSENDVVDLPEANASALVSRNAADKIE